jgi:eukaryotic-like serine/threonine-protein kinase
MVKGNQDVWLMEKKRGLPQKFTSGPEREFEPVWSHNASRIIFGSGGKGVPGFHERSVSGAGTETVLWESSENKNPYDWSSDDRWLLFGTQSPKTAGDLWVLPLDGEKQPIAIAQAQTASAETNGRFSPNVHWIAYQSNESGRVEVYIQPFPGPGGRKQISTGGGTSPQWGREGKELFYLDPDNRLMAVSLALNGPKVEPGTGEALFSLSPGAAYTASPDGQQFLINEITKDPSPITILLNWKPH